MRNPQRWHPVVTGTFVARTCLSWRLGGAQLDRFIESAAEPIYMIIDAYGNLGS